MNDPRSETQEPTVIGNASRLSRRRFLALAGLACGGVTLAGCGGTTSVQSGASGDNGKPKKNTGEISILTWETYHERPWLADYERKTGVKVTATTVGSSDELYAKIRSGALKPDIMYPDSGSVARYVEAGMVIPLEAAKVGNRGNITPGLDWEGSNNVDGKLYALPYNWGTQPLMYNTEEVSPAPTSWGALWDPKYKGRVLMFDDAYTVFPMISLYVGAQDPYNMTDEEFEKCRQALTELRPQVRAIATGFDDAVNIFAAGDSVIGYCQNISEVFALRERGTPFDYAFPQEKTPHWIDNAVLLPQGNRQEVYDFINAGLSLPWQGRFVEFSNNNGILTAEKAERANVPRATIEKTNLADQDQAGFWDGFSLMRTPEDMDRRLELWNEFKAGG